MTEQNWTVAEAKAKFSELIQSAHSHGPQTITKNGRTAAIVVSPDEWQRRTARAGTLADFLATSPLRNSGLKINRTRRPARLVKL
jgi:prevent-host-death family protein